MKQIVNKLIDGTYTPEEIEELVSYIGPIYDGVPLESTAPAVAYLSQLRDDINTRIAEIEADVLASFELGMPVTGYEMKAGKTSRSIPDEKAAVAFLSKYLTQEQLYKPQPAKFKTITEIERALGATGLKPADREPIMDKICIKTTGAAKLVRV